MITHVTNINLLIVDLLLGVKNVKTLVEETGLKQVIIKDEIAADFSAGTEEQFGLAGAVAAQKFGYEDLVVQPSLSFVLNNDKHIVTVAIATMKDEFILLIHNPAADALGVIHASELEASWLKSIIANELTREL